MAENSKMENWKTIIRAIEERSSFVEFVKEGQMMIIKHRDMYL